MENFFDYIKERGFVYQATHEDEIKNLLNSGRKITFYLGIDPTADSLHIGHFYALRMFSLMQREGHKGIVLVGGATAQIGDPTGKSDMRKMMSKQGTADNAAKVKKMVSRFVNLEGENAAILVDNSDWMNNFSYIDFMREIGVHFNVAHMLASEAYKKRMENGGLTFLEMGYMLMQAYDFVILNRKYGCELQIGGSDQWGNIVAGTELSRKINYHQEGRSTADCPDTYGLTSPLLMTKDGKKMGKTEAGTIWVDPEKTSAYAFYQYFYNMPDEETAKLLKVFTDIPSAEIEQMCKDDIIAAKKRMAYETTMLVHGKEETDKAVQASLSLFAGGAASQDVPSKEFPAARAAAGIKLVDLAVETGLFPSKKEARRMIQQGGFSADGKKVSDPDALAPMDKDSVLLQKGKKTFLKVLFK